MEEFGFQVNVDPPGDDAFDFAFALQDGQAAGLDIGVTGAVYTVTEASPPPEGWSLTNIDCSENLGVSVGAPDMGTGTITISFDAPPEEGSPYAVCVFSNTGPEDAPTMTPTPPGGAPGTPPGAPGGPGSPGAAATPEPPDNVIVGVGTNTDVGVNNTNVNGNTNVLENSNVNSTTNEQGQDNEQGQSAESNPSQSQRGGGASVSID